MATPSGPIGVRFYPSDKDLLNLLRYKICGRVLEPKLIGVTDVYKFEPCDLPEQSLLKTRDRQWFFFSPIDRKYGKGTRLNRATTFGFWKATGKEKDISRKTRKMGVRKTLVFHEGRAPKGKPTNWVMHEYAMDKDELKRCKNTGDYFAVYKLFMKSGPGPKNGEQYWAPAEEDEEVGFSEQEDSDPVSDVNCFEPTTSTAAATAISTSTTIQQCSGVGSMLSSDKAPVGVENLDETLGKFITNDEAEVNQQQCQPIANGSQAGGVELVEVPKASDSMEELFEIEGDFFELDDIPDLAFDLPSEGNFANNGTYQFTEFADLPPYGGHSMVLEEANEGAHHGLIGNMDDCSPHSQCTSFQRSNVFSSPAITHVVMAPPASGNLYASSLMNGEITQGFLGMPESVPTNPCHVGLRELGQGIRGDVNLGCIAEWGRDCCQYSFEGCCLEEDVDEEEILNSR